MVGGGIRSKEVRTGTVIEDAERTRTSTIVEKVEIAGPQGEAGPKGPRIRETEHIHVHTVGLGVRRARRGFGQENEAE